MSTMLTLEQQRMLLQRQQLLQRSRMELGEHPQQQQQRLRLEQQEQLRRMTAAAASGGSFPPPPPTIMSSMMPPQAQMQQPPQAPMSSLNHHLNHQMAMESALAARAADRFRHQQEIEQIRMQLEMERQWHHQQQQQQQLQDPIMAARFGGASQGPTSQPPQGVPPSSFTAQPPPPLSSPLSNTRGIMYPPVGGNVDRPKFNINFAQCPPPEASYAAQPAAAQEHLPPLPQQPPASASHPPTAAAAAAAAAASPTCVSPVTNKVSARVVSEASLSSREISPQSARTLAAPTQEEAESKLPPATSPTPNKSVKKSATAPPEKKSPARANKPTVSKRKPSKPIMPKADTKWLACLEQLKEYKAIHGDCTIPRGYPLNPRLASWVAEQRKQYKLLQDGKRSSITPERIELLNQQNFAWNAQVAAWDRRFGELKDYKEKHGHCHVPLNNVDPKLGLWVKEQRRHYALLKQEKPSHMTAKRAQLLMEIGFCWDTHEATWLERLREVKAFKEEFGHCRIPTYLLSNPKLSTWANHQRRQYTKFHNGEPCHITKERIAALDDIGFSWRRRKRGSRHNSKKQNKRKQNKRKRDSSDEENDSHDDSSPSSSSDDSSVAESTSSHSSSEEIC